MIKKISFKNYKVLRDASIDLGRYNVVIGPNGSGKSTLLSALRLLDAAQYLSASRVQRIGLLSGNGGLSVEITIQDGDNLRRVDWSAGLGETIRRGEPTVSPRIAPTWDALADVRLYSLDEGAIASPVALEPHMKLGSNGKGLAGVLDSMRDISPEQFEELNDEVSRLLPEFDRILFETPESGKRALMLRTRDGKSGIKAVDLSQGTLLALALLTIAYLPSPPDIIGIEEPDRGIHPRLYRDIQAALYRLAYPESFGLDRKPVQVIVTTHSPFLLDLHRDTPEEIIIAEKTENGAEFHRLTERPELMEILDDVSLGEAWYSGVLGGVPAGS